MGQDRPIPPYDRMSVILPRASIGALIRRVETCQ